MQPSEHVLAYLSASAELARTIEPTQIDAMAAGLAAVREGGGRLFVLGVGGGAGHASHAVNDFRKLCGLESYAPTDNVSELTARTNDDGWETSFGAWLEVSRLSAGRRPDRLLGRGRLARAQRVGQPRERDGGAREIGASIFGVVGAPGGTLAALADVAVLIDRRHRAAHAARRVLPGGRLARPRLAPRARVKPATGSRSRPGRERRGRVPGGREERVRRGVPRPRRRPQRARSRRRLGLPSRRWTPSRCGSCPCRRER